MESLLCFITEHLTTTCNSLRLVSLVLVLTGIDCMIVISAHCSSVNSLHFCLDFRNFLSLICYAWRLTRNMFFYTSKFFFFFFFKSERLQVPRLTSISSLFWTPTTLQTSPKLDAHTCTETMHIKYWQNVHPWLTFLGVGGWVGWGWTRD